MRDKILIFEKERDVLDLFSPQFLFQRETHFVKKDDEVLGCTLEL